MGAVPKRRHTASKRDLRRMHVRLKKPETAVCSKCNSPVLSHKVCPNCGFYKNREVINVFAKMDKKEKKQKQRELQDQEQNKPLDAEQLSK